MLQGPRTIGRLLKLRVQKTPERYALGWIENGEVKNMTFTDYRNQVEVLVNGLNRVGLHVGDKVAILAQTSKEWHLLDLAIQCSRSCVVPIYPSYLPHEVDFIFQHSDSSILIVENDKQMEKVIAHMEKWSNLKAVISLHDLSEETLK